MPLVNQIMVKESDILNIVDQLRTTIPDEIKMARRIIQEKERILAQAQADANTLLARAQEESERAIKREGLLLAAGERSQQIVREAQEQAERLKDDADAYVGETLRSLRDHLASIEISVGRSILSIEKGLESLESPLEEAPSPGEEDGLEDSYEEFEEPAEVPSRPRAVPRRASLAADTMGVPNYQQDIIPGQ
jgi:hypothetical protein